MFRHILHYRQVSGVYKLKAKVINLRTVPLRSPFIKGGFRGIFKLFKEIPPAPL